MNVVVAMSGGVDSSVAAALLQQQGHTVTGIFMKNWSPLDGQSLSDCPWEQDQADAEAVCKHLGIPFKSVNFEREYREKVVDYLVREYAAGRTPNPDVLCNKEIKFAALREVALKQGAEALATGHYVRLVDGKLHRGVQGDKDQSYFLYSLNKEQLGQALFPIGHLTKPEVRKLAEEFGLQTAAKKDSQGICFIGQLNLKDFLEGEIGVNEGDLMLLKDYQQGVSLLKREEAAEKVGRHHGASFYTIGEKMGGYLDNRLYRHVTGETQVPHIYIVSKDAKNNQVFCTRDRQDPDLQKTTFFLENLRCTGEADGVSIVDILEKIPQNELSVQLRYQQVPSVVREYGIEDGKLYVTLETPVWGASVGQSLVFFHDQVVLGGGVVCNIP